MDDNREKRFDDEVEACLARVRRTVAASRELLAMVEQRRNETDRMLASQGLTREQVEAMRFTPEQLKAANEELKRRGMEPIDEEELLVKNDGPSVDAEYTANQSQETVEDKEDLGSRRRKFSVMMNNLRL